MYMKGADGYIEGIKPEVDFEAEPLVRTAPRRSRREVRGGIRCASWLMLVPNARNSTVCIRSNVRWKYMEGV
jgi:hypothetical protein